MEPKTKTKIAMKKYVIVLLLALPLCSTGQIITDTAIRPVDTLVGRQPNLHYTEWYDDCPSYLLTSLYRAWAERLDYVYQMYDQLYGDRLRPSEERTVLREEWAPQRLPIKGVAVMIPVDQFIRYPGEAMTDNRVPEYAMILKHSDTDHFSLVLLDSARWDNAEPHLLKLPKNRLDLETADSDRFVYCLLYEALFDRPVVVDSIFYSGGSTYNNAFDTTINVHKYYNIPTKYFIARMKSWECIECPHPNNYVWADTNFNNLRNYTNPSFEESPYFGPFLPIIDTGSYQLTVLSADNEMGAVDGGGIFQTMSMASVSATANEGFRFTQWSDGVTANPREVEVYCDSTITAFFAENTDIDNADKTDQVFALTPNPAHERIIVHTDGHGTFLWEILDIDGHLMQSGSSSVSTTSIDLKGLPAGVYMLSMSKDGIKSAKRFVKK